MTTSTHFDYNTQNRVDTQQMPLTDQEFAQLLEQRSIHIRAKHDLSDQQFDALLETIGNCFRRYMSIPDNISDKQFDSVLAFVSKKHRHRNPISLELSSFKRLVSIAHIESSINLHLWLNFVRFPIEHLDDALYFLDQEQFRFINVSLQCIPRNAKITANVRRIRCLGLPKKFDLMIGNKLKHLQLSLQHDSTLLEALMHHSSLETLILKFWDKICYSALARVLQTTRLTRFDLTACETVRPIRSTRFEIHGRKLLIDAIHEPMQILALNYLPINIDDVTNITRRVSTLTQLEIRDQHMTDLSSLSRIVPRTNLTSLHVYHSNPWRKNLNFKCKKNFRRLCMWRRVCILISSYRGNRSHPFVNSIQPLIPRILHLSGVYLYHERYFKYKREYFRKLLDKFVDSMFMQSELLRSQAGHLGHVSHPQKRGQKRKIV